MQFFIRDSQINDTCTFYLRCSYYKVNYLKHTGSVLPEYKRATFSRRTRTCRSNCIRKKHTTLNGDLCEIRTCREANEIPNTHNYSFFFYKYIYKTLHIPLSMYAVPSYFYCELIRFRSYSHKRFLVSIVWVCVCVLENR